MKIMYAATLILATFLSKDAFSYQIICASDNEDIQAYGEIEANIVKSASLTVKNIQVELFEVVDQSDDEVVPNFFTSKSSNDLFQITFADDLKSAEIEYFNILNSGFEIDESNYQLKCQER